MRRPRLVVDRFGTPPLRPGDGLHVRQGTGRSRIFVCFIIGARGRLCLRGPSTPRTLAAARAIVDKRFCGERRA